jgi:N utilization substance protein B
MLTRRHIRIKVMQSVYSFSLGKERKLDEELKFFKQSVFQSFDLYLLLLALLKALENYLGEQCQTYDTHKIKKEQKYFALKKLSQNKILAFISSHTELENQLKNKKFIRWDLEFVFLKDLVQEIIESQKFKDYFAIDNPSLKQEQQFLVSCFKEHIAPSVYLFNYLEDHQLTWIDDLPVVNTFLLKILKQLDVDKPKSLLFPKPIENIEDLEFGVELLEKTLGKDEELAAELEGKTPNWEADRIAQLDRVILKIAIIELLYFPSIPERVTINEYLEIAKDYSTPNSNNFINGVLDKLVREYKANKRMIKTGRGLL